MKHFLPTCLAAAVLSFTIASSAFAGTIDDLRGAWTLTNTNENGQVLTRTIEVKGNKFTFRMTSADKQTVLFAKGDLKIETVSSLNLINFINIEGGRSADDTNPVDDDRHCVYTLDGKTLTLALNFDKDRDKGPYIEVYTKTEKTEKAEK